MKTQLKTNTSLLSAVRPLYIAGPCSAESESQVVEAACSLSKTGKVQVFRAGVWKPRTRPGSFEGMGEQALAWLQLARNISGMPFAVEVATPAHLEAALKASVDMVWIGARTTANPFSVQELANALRGVSVPVLVKNPVSPDPELWIGAVERIRLAGISELALVHRGFSPYVPGRYRNPPLWPIAKKVKAHFGSLPMLLDPSHICGNRHLLLETMQQGAARAYAGMMLECHPDPESALSDAHQQVRPDVLNALLQRLDWPQATGEDPAGSETL